MPVAPVPILCACTKPTPFGVCAVCQPPAPIHVERPVPVEVPAAPPAPVRCAALGCDTPREGRLLCRPHWRLVPAWIVQRIQDTWAAYERAPSWATAEAHCQAKTLAIIAIRRTEVPDAWLAA